MNAHPFAPAVIVKPLPIPATKFRIPSLRNLAHMKLASCINVAQLVTVTLRLIPQLGPVTSRALPDSQSGYEFTGEKVYLLYYYRGIHPSIVFVIYRIKVDLDRLIRNNRRGPYSDDFVPWQDMRKFDGRKWYKGDRPVHQGN